MMQKPGGTGSPARSSSPRLTALPPARARSPRARVCRGTASGPAGTIREYTVDRSEILSRYPVDLSRGKAFRGGIRGTTYAIAVSYVAGAPGWPRADANLDAGGC